MGYTRPNSEILRQSLEKPKQHTRQVLLTIPEACAYLRVSRHTIYRLLNERKLASVRVLRRRLVPLETIESFIAREAEGTI